MERPTDLEIRRALGTHNFLRLLVNAPVVLLFLTMIIWAKFSDEDLPTSISGYYATPVRDVFVGSMVAIAACMIVYKGTSRLEDYSLNLFGVFSLFVALVPTNIAGVLDGPDGDQVREGLRASLIAVAVTLVGFFVIDYWKVTRGDWKPLFLSSGWPRIAVYLASAAAVAFGVLLVVRFNEDLDYAWVHNFAAIATVACLGIAVSSHGWPAQSTVGGESAEDISRLARWPYRLIVGAMILAGIAFAWLHLGVEWKYSVIAIEVAEILLFFVFWLFETTRHWYRPPAQVPSTDAVS